MTSRKALLKNTVIATAGIALSTPLQYLSAKTTSKKSPIRFIFMTKSNGLRPDDLVPVSFSSTDKSRDKSKSALQIDLTKHKLPKWMKSIVRHQKEMAIIQGLSSYRMASGHHGNAACLGMFKDKGTLNDLKWATADVELGRLYPSPFEHIEVQTVGDHRGIVSGRAATGPLQANYAFADPKTAYKELFKTASNSKSAKAQLEINSLILDHLKQSTNKLNHKASAIEALKINNYAKTIQQVKARDTMLKDMSGVIAKYLPMIDKKKYFAEDTNTIDRQKAFVEILCSALKAGLTNTVLFSLDTLKTPYTGLPQLDAGDLVQLHDIGHGKGFADHSSQTVREWVRIHHMNLMNKIVDHLKQTPEGEGTMFDNSVVMYQAENGETHHSDGSEQPIIMIAGKNTKMNFIGSYTRLPGYGQQGHKTLGNWYTTLLNNHGNPIEHFGQEDLNLKRHGIVNQKGPIKEFLV